MDLKKMHKYWQKHVWEAKIAHTLLGVGLGFLLAYPLVGTHPVRWGLVFVGASLLWHLKAGR